MRSSPARGARGGCPPGDEGRAELEKDSRRVLARVCGGTPVALVDADVVFLRDPSPEWRDGMSRFDAGGGRGGRRGGRAARRRHENHAPPGDAKIAPTRAVVASRRDATPGRGVTPGESPRARVLQLRVGANRRETFQYSRRIRRRRRQLRHRDVGRGRRLRGRGDGDGILLRRRRRQGEVASRRDGSKNRGGVGVARRACQSRGRQNAPRWAWRSRGKASRRERMAARKVARRVARRERPRGETRGGYPAHLQRRRRTHAATARVAGADPANKTRGWAGSKEPSRGATGRNGGRISRENFRVGDDRHVDFEA